MFKASVKFVKIQQKFRLGTVQCDELEPLAGSRTVITEHAPVVALLASKKYITICILMKSNAKIKTETVSQSHTHTHIYTCHKNSRHSGLIHFKEIYSYEITIKMLIYVWLCCGWE
jgi:hypothetical protein